MKNKILITLFLICSTLGFSQQEVTWKDLSKVSFIEKYFPDHDETLLHPKFSKSVKALDGKLVKITGFFLSMALSEQYYVLSKGPLSACFFCGVGGPETMIELQSVVKLNFKTDQVVSITGILKLNNTDVEHFNYILTECEGVLVE